MAEVVAWVCMVLLVVILLALGLVLIWLHLQWGRFLRFMGWS